MRLSCLAVLILVVLLACGGEPSSSAVEGPEVVRVYRHVLDGVPGSLDPAHADSIYSATLVVNLFDTLYRYKYLARSYELTPNLAAAMPELLNDGLTYEIRLRPAARFMDSEVFPGGHGRAVTAADVVYSLARHFDPATRSRGRWLWRGRIRGLNAPLQVDSRVPAIEGLEVIDDHTLRIHLRSPFAQLPMTLATALSAIVPHEAVAFYGPAFGRNPVGSGPFALRTINESRAVLEKNPEFRDERVNLADEGYSAERHGSLRIEHIDGRSVPLLDRLEIEFIAEPTVRWTSFIAPDGTDFVMVPPDLSSSVLQSTEPIVFSESLRSDYFTHSAPEAGLVFFGFNLAGRAIGDRGDLPSQEQNRALRCAIRDAFDWGAFNRLFHHGLGRVFSGVIPPQLPGFSNAADRASIPYGPTAGRDRIERAGLAPEDLPTLIYGRFSSVEQRRIFDLFRAKLLTIGFPPDRLQVRSFPNFGAYSQAIAEGQLDVFLLGWTLAYPDPQYILQLFYGPNAAPGINGFNYASERYDRLFEQAGHFADGAERNQLYRRLNQMIIDDCVVIGSLSRTRLFVWKKHVRMLPDRDLNSGFFLRFVDVVTDD